MSIFKRCWNCLLLLLRQLRVSLQIVYGAWKVWRMPKPIVSIFGGARLPEQDQYWKMAHELSATLVEHKISVLTGGGPGVMEAASCGAVVSKTHVITSMGIGVRDLGESPNHCVQDYIELDYFFARKWLLTRYSSGFIVFPGGFGTLDELSEVLTLIQTKRFPAVPIVLIGVEYWDDLVAWITKEALEHQLIEKEHLALITLTDDLYEAFCIVQQGCKPGV